jgi:ArsR family transcriptional regulator
VKIVTIWTIVFMQVCVYLSLRSSKLIDTKLSQEINQLHAEICSALADPNRILILYALAEKPHSVTELAQTLGITQPTTSRHLTILRERGLVISQREGQSVIYILTDKNIILALDLLRSVLANNLSKKAILVDQLS